jgi:plastocyanin
MTGHAAESNRASFVAILDRKAGAMRRALTLSTLLAIAGLALAGCGGGGGSGSTTSGGASSAPAQTSGGASTTPAKTTGGGSGGAAVAIAMKNIQFSPTTATVKVGQKVTWTNDDGVAHNVTATSGASFRSSDFGQGGTFSFTPTRAGTIEYVCTLHPGMNGTLVVK